jgi:hypothetical protein
MTVNPPLHKLDNQHRWYLTTVCGFTIGLILGVWPISQENIFFSRNAGFLEVFFWVFPAMGAGLGMGTGQWIVIRNSHKNAYLWIVATTAGLVLITGGMLFVFTFMNYFRSGNLPWLLSQGPGDFSPFAIIIPALSFTGPFLQWLMVRRNVKNQPFNGLLKLSAGWLLAMVMLFIMLGIAETITQSHNKIFAYSLGIAATIPAGLIFAYFTKDILTNALHSGVRMGNPCNHHPN